MSRQSNRWPAVLDLIQAGSALALVLFLWAHMLAVSSILLGKPAMFKVSQFFEGSFLFDEPQPMLVSLVALIVLVLVVTHAVLAIRKIPASYRQYSSYFRHLRRIGHTDTTLWLVQVGTGMVLMFLVTVHLYEFIVQPGNIGPYASADRMVSGGALPLGIVLLLAAEVHGGIGLYRLIIKWGWFGLESTTASRTRLRQMIYALIVFMVLLGALTQAAYVKIGLEHRDRAGERYYPGLEAAD